jgi:hypothetical protein
MGGVKSWDDVAVDVFDAVLRQSGIDAMRDDHAQSGFVSVA